MILFYCLAFSFLVTSVHTLVRRSHQFHRSLSCPSWSALEDSLNSLDFRTVDCTTSSSCTAMNCSGIFQQKDFLLGIEIQPCENISLATFLINIPSLNVMWWKKTLKTGEMVQIPGIQLTTVFGTIDGFLCASIKRESTYIIVNITVKGRIRNGKTDTWPIKKDLLSKTQIPITCEEHIVINSPRKVSSHPHNGSIIESKTSEFPVVSSMNHQLIDMKNSRKMQVSANLIVKKSINEKKDSISCKVYSIYSCKENEKCVMKGNSTSGVCECQTAYQRDPMTKSCVSNSTILPTGTTSHSNSSGFGGLSKKTQTLIVICSSAVSCIIIIGLIIFLIYKCKWNVYRRLNIHADDQDLLMRDTDNAVVT